MYYITCVGRVSWHGVEYVKKHVIVDRTICLPAFLRAMYNAERGNEMKLTREEVLHIAALAKVGMTEEDITHFQEQLSNILENFEILAQVDTENIPPTAQPNTLCNVTKTDCDRPSLSPDEVLANAPRREGDFFRIRAVLEED